MLEMSGTKTFIPIILVMDCLGICLKNLKNSNKPTLTTNQKSLVHLQYHSNIIDGRNPANQLRLVVYPVIYRVFVHRRWLFGISSINSSIVFIYNGAVRTTRFLIIAHGPIPERMGNEKCPIAQYFQQWSCSQWCPFQTFAYTLTFQFTIYLEYWQLGTWFQIYR